MGIMRSSEEAETMELHEFRRMLLSCAAVHRRKDDEDDVVFRGPKNDDLAAPDDDVLNKLVCVTSGVSYLGIAVVKQLLVNGYSVRIIVDNQEDVENLREMVSSGEMRLSNTTIEVVMAKLTEVESLADAFDGCRGVFHTASFIDPAGISGYTRAMVDVEVNSTKNVIKACGVAESVRRCVLTSSLLTCIWRDISHDHEVSRVIDHKCWSDETVCINKKLWYALGKLRAEKAAWEIAKENRLKLATICPGLITGTSYCQQSPTSTIAYLKGVQEMYTNGLLATIDIDKLAKAHVRVFEEMNKETCPRYICFDHVLERSDEIEKLARDTGITAGFITGEASPRFDLSNAKFVRLMLRTRRCNE